MLAGPSYVQALPSGSESQLRTQLSTQGCVWSSEQVRHEAGAAAPRMKPADGSLGMFRGSGHSGPRNPPPAPQDVWLRTWRPRAQAVVRAGSRRRLAAWHQPPSHPSVWGDGGAQRNVLATGKGTGNTCMAPCSQRSFCFSFLVSDEETEAPAQHLPGPSLDKNAAAWTQRQAAPRHTTVSPAAQLADLSWALIWD